jgi:hypothetical protein
MRLVLATALALVVSHSAAAQNKAKRGKATAKPAVTQATDSTARPSSDPVLRGMQWRLVGPFRGGRAAGSYKQIPAHQTSPHLVFRRLVV